MSERFKRQSEAGMETVKETEIIGWRAMAESLPPKPGRYLAYIASSKTTVLADWAGMGPGRGWNYGYVTHWAPIPEEPAS